MNQVFFDGYVLGNDDQRLKFFDEAVYDNTKFNLISEENLSGNIYTGNGACESLSKVDDDFYGYHVLLIFRDPYEFVYSLYSNDVLHGQLLPLDLWIEKNVMELTKKTDYQRLVDDVLKICTGKEKMSIFHYPDYLNQNYFNEVLNLEKFNGRKSHYDNVGRSLLGNTLMRHTNSAGFINFKGKAKLFSLFSKSSRDVEIVRRLFTPKLLNYFDWLDELESKSNNFKVYKPDGLIQGFEQT